MAEHASQSQPGKSPGARPGATPGPKAASSGRERVTTQVREAMIREAAYFRAEHRAFAPGNELGDWFDAEREIDAVLTGPKPDRAPAR